jgi:probable O-glycosylation ligase (exosortase A-associated)
MLRNIFVSSILICGVVIALRGPLEALLLYLWIAYFRPESWVFTGFFRSLNLSYIVGLYLVFRAVFSNTVFRVDLRTALLLAILVQGTMSTVNSLHVTYYGDLITFAKALIITYLISVLGSDTQRLRLILLTICLSLSFEGAKQGWAQLVTNPGAVNINEIPLLGDNNGVAVGMLMLVPMLMALARTSASKYERWLHQFLAIGILYRGVSTYSRGGFLAAAALGAMFVLRSPRKGRALIGAALAAVIVLSVLPARYWGRMDTIRVETAEERDKSAQGRIHFWQVALRMADSRPLLGVGLNGYNVAYNDYDFSLGAFGEARSVHSAWLGIVAELGYVGLLLFMANVGFAFLACRRARRLARSGLVSKELRELAVAFETALVVFCVGGTFVIFQYSEILWHLFGLTAAMNYLVSQEIAAASQVQPVFTASTRPALAGAPAAAQRT